MVPGEGIEMKKRMTRRDVAKGAAMVAIGGLLAANGVTKKDDSLSADPEALVTDEVTKVTWRETHLIGAVLIASGRP
jgi:hypothetical protein